MLDEFIANNYDEICNYKENLLLAYLNSNMLGQVVFIDKGPKGAAAYLAIIAYPDCLKKS